MAPTQSVIEQLRNDILSGRIPPGDRLLEIQLSSQYGCSRASVRSAIMQLTAEGLVEREANRGAAVRRISVEEAIQITEARAALEALIAARAAEVATEDQRRALLDVIEDMRSAVADGRQRDYSDLNEVLHRQLREVSGHVVAAGLVDNLLHRAAHHQYRLALMPGRSSESLPQHAAIVDAVVAGDPGAAREAMVEHLASVVEVLRGWSGIPLA